MDRVRGLGYLPDHPEVVAARLHAGERFGAARVPPSGSLLTFAPPVLDQGTTSACVGHAMATGITTALAATGRDLGWIPSADLIYRLARCIDRAGREQPLYDLGTRIGSACDAITRWGIVPGRVPIDVDPRAIDREPTLDELERAALRLVVGEYGIASGPSAPDLVRAAITTGHPVIGGVLVGDRAQNWREGQVPLTYEDTLDPHGGGHAMCILAYDDGTFRARSSWSRDFGLMGDMIGDESWLARWSDLVVLDVSIEETA